MNTMRATVAVAVILTALPQAARAGAWAQAPGHFYAKLSGISYSADEVYNDMGVKQAMGMDDDTFDGRQAFLYVEYGLRERLTLVSQFSAGVLTDEDRLVRNETTGTGDLDLGLKYQAIDDPLVVAPQLSLKIPSGYDADHEPAMGTGDIDLEARVLVSKSLYPAPVYAGLDGGYRIRGGDFSNQVTWGAEIGATPHARLFVKLAVASSNTLTDDAESLGIVGVSSQVSEGDFTKVGLNAAVALGGGLWLDGLVERIVDGENIGAGMSWGIGLSVSR